jgi:hypothetical protein
MAVGPCPAIVAPGRRSIPARERGPESASDLAAGTPVVARSFPHGGPTVGPDVKETATSSAFGRRPVARVRRTPRCPQKSRAQLLAGNRPGAEHVHCGPRSCCTPSPGDQAPPSSGNPVPEPSNPHPHGQDRSESPPSARVSPRRNSKLAFAVANPSRAPRSRPRRPKSSASGRTSERQ